MSITQRIRRSFRKWRLQQTSKLTSGELNVIDAILRGADDPRANKFLRQWTYASGFKRAFPLDDERRYNVRWATTRGCLSHLSLLEDLQSEPLRVVDLQSGMELQFVLHARNGGSCGPLVGSTVDGSPWPIDWDIDGGLSLATAARGLLSLPEREDQIAGIARIKDWLGEDIAIDCLEFVEVFAPASKDDLDGMAVRLSAEIPSAYRELLAVSNGLLIGETLLAGTESVQMVQQPMRDYASAIWIANDLINGLGDGIYLMPVDDLPDETVKHADMYGGCVESAKDLKSFIRKRIAELPETYGGFIAASE